MRQGTSPAARAPSRCAASLLARPRERGAPAPRRDLGPRSRHPRARREDRALTLGPDQPLPPLRARAAQPQRAAPPEDVRARVQRDRCRAPAARAQRVVRVVHGGEGSRAAPVLGGGAFVGPALRREPRASTSPTRPARRGGHNVKVQRPPWSGDRCSGGGGDAAAEQRCRLAARAVWHAARVASARCDLRPAPVLRRLNNDSIRFPAPHALAAS